MSKVPEMTSVPVLNQRSYDDCGRFDFGNEYTDGTLNRMINSLVAIRDSIPPEYRDVARCGFDSEHDSSCITIEVSYQRPATVAEIAKRVESAKRSYETAAAAERLAYERLKAKYG